MATVIGPDGNTHETSQVYVMQVKSVVVKYWLDLKDGEEYDEEDITEACAIAWVGALGAAHKAVNNIEIESEATDYEEVEYS